MSYFLYKIRYRQFFINPEGIKPFAEKCISKFVSQAAVKKANVLTAYINVLKEERAKRRIELAESEALDRMDDGSFALKKKKSKRMKFVVYVTILFEIFLNYISTLIFIQGEGLLYILVRWGLSIILTLSAMLVADGLLTKLIPEESVRVKGGKSIAADDESHEKNTRLKRIIGLVVLPLLLIAVEMAIIGVATERAVDMESGKSGTLLSRGFILLSMALPIIAGYFKWDSEQHGKLYQNTAAYHKTKKLLHVLNLIVSSNMKDVKDVVETSIRTSWQIFSRFKLYKENYNIKNAIPKEDCSRHYSANAESFRAEALNHFGTEVKDILKELEAAKNKII